MPVQGIVAPRSWGPTIPAGTDRPPWLRPNVGPVRRARTYVVAHGPELLRAADADPPSPPPAAGRTLLGSSAPVQVQPRRR